MIELTKKGVVHLNKEEKIKQEKEKIKKQLMSSLPDITESNAEELAEEMVDRIIKEGKKSSRLKTYKHIVVATVVGLIVSLIFMYFK